MPNSFYSTIDDVKEDGYAKFVKVNGEYRFDSGPFADHRQLVNENELVESAGSISVFPNFWKMMTWHSESFNVTANEADIEPISKLLELPFKNKY